MPKKLKKKLAKKAHLSKKKQKATSPKLKKSEVVLVSTLQQEPSVAPVTKSSKRKHFFFTIAILLVGINLFAAGGLYLVYKRTILSFAVSPVVTADAHLRRDVPTHIAIDSANIDLDIQEAEIENGVWQTSDKNVTHLNTSMRPGEGGNIVLYGHNLRKIFGPLKVVKIGDKINVRTTDNKLYEYTVADIQTVSPKDIEKVLPTDHEILTVYTCTGFLDSKRLVITAYPSKVSTL